MSLASKLVAFALRQVFDVPADAVVEAVEQHFRDHSQSLPRALERAHERAWQALGVALAGDGLLDRIKVFFASGDDKGVREQVRLFLQGNALPLDRTPADFRQACLEELQRLRKGGLLSTRGLDAAGLARDTAGFTRHGDPSGMVAAAHQAVGQVADDLLPDYPNLARLLRTPAPAGPPLLASAFCYFFRREVETDDELAHGLFFDGLRQLAASQAKAFGEVGKALATLGNQFDAVFEQLGRIEAAVAQTQATATAAHGAVLDLQAEMQRLGALQLANVEEVHSLLVQVQQHLGRAGMQRGEVRPQHSLSLRGEDERRAVRALLARFRRLPADEQRRVPALLNGLGKLQLGTGDFEAARGTFAEVAGAVADPPGRAEAAANSYRAALEQRRWDDALGALTQAARLDPARFAPFPLQRYRPQRILGAGGFGTVFLCQDAFFRNREVAIKTLHEIDLERGLEEVFGEAHALSELNHPAIIGVIDCSYADLERQARPYVVMPYFPGVSLAAHVERHSPLGVPDFVAVGLQVARGMQAAHARGILHRDLKPANVLVRKEGDGWQVKVIDFGLAMRQQAAETGGARASGEDTVLGRSLAGTVKYAPPEQLGELPGVRAGPYSDVYAFGKTCCFALFRTTEPKSRHWAGIPRELAEMLEQCTEEDLPHRLADFEPVLQVLQGLAQARPGEGPRPPAGGEARKAATAAAGPTSRGEAGRNLPVQGAGPTAGKQPDRKSLGEIRGVEIAVPGDWSARAPEAPEEAWTWVAWTPGPLGFLGPGQVYRLLVRAEATDAQLSALVRLWGWAGLQSLSLMNCDAVTDVGLAHLGGLTGLRQLQLVGSSRITDAGLAHLRSLAGLRSLNLRGCRLITDAGLAHLKGLAGLEELDLGLCGSITDAGLGELRALTGLQRLNLFQCRALTDAGLAHLQGLTALRHLDLGCGERITNRGLSHLKGLASLESLGLFACGGVTDAGLVHLRGLAALQALDLTRCRMITEAGVAALKEALPRCTIKK
jgi:tRNA A-37 threonylcarbamoyl transferase component Bud32